MIKIGVKATKLIEIYKKNFTGSSRRNFPAPSQHWITHCFSFQNRAQNRNQKKYAKNLFHPIFFLTISLFKNVKKYK